MACFPVFLSVVVVLRNQSPRLESVLSTMARSLGTLVADYEIIVVDNASDDESVARLHALAGDNGLPNLQVYALTKAVDADTAAWVGLENALGDLVAVVDPLADDLAFLPEMLARAAGGIDVVFAHNRQAPPRSLPYRCAGWVFNSLFRRLCGIDLEKEAPRFRLLSKRVVNFILRHPQPAVGYRHLPATGGFSRVTLHYNAPQRTADGKRLRDSFDRGLRLLVSTTRAPLRLATSLSLFGAVANLAYSLYVVGVALLKPDVAPGWVSLSLQLSGMLFLISLVLLVLGEYVLHLSSLSGEGPPYHVGQEFASTRMTRRESLNIAEAARPGQAPAAAGARVA